MIPMAGAGSRFSNEGYQQPKPLIPIHGVPMIEVVVNNLRPEESHRFIFICQKKHIQEYGLNKYLKDIAPSSIIVEVDGLTEGAACTVLAAKEYINNDESLMIANSDQFIDIDINTYLRYFSSEKLDGLIMTMHSDDPKWSFVKLDSSGYVIDIAEKKVISNEATVGIYNFTVGRSFVEAAEEMILQNQRVNGEFYVAPVYNVLLERNNIIGIFNIGSVGSGLFGLGIPDDLRKFMNHPVSKRSPSN